MNNVSSIRMPVNFAILLFAILFSIPGTAADVTNQEKNQVYEQARQFLQTGQARQAFDLLVEYEADWSGDDAYDYLFGVAALDSGEAGEAIFSLQRLVASQPEFAGARMELARAYFNIGDNELARGQFKRILADNPPPKVQIAATEYMQAIQTRGRDYTASGRYYIDLGLGWDSNAPAATDESVFLSFILDDKNLEQASAFGEVMLGATWNKPLTPQSQLLLTTRIDHRSHPSAHYVDASNVDLGIGWLWQSSKHSLSMSANGVFSALGGEHNKNTLGVSGHYTYSMSENRVLSAFARYGSLRFEESILMVRDVDQWTAGISIGQHYANGLFSVMAISNREDATEAGSPFSTDGYGLRISNNWYRPGGRIYFVEASFSATEYDGLFFNTTREDDTYTVTLGISLAPTQGWTSTIRLNFSEKNSTVSLYEYERFEIAYSLRKLL